MTTATMGRGSLAKINIVLGQGQTNSMLMVWKPDGVTPKDFTGWTARMQARRRPGAADAWFTISDVPSEDGSITLSSAGEITLRIEPAASSRWGTSNKSGTWDLELIDPSGVVITFARGEITVELETTTFGD